MIVRHLLLAGYIYAAMDKRLWQTYLIPLAALPAMLYVFIRAHVLDFTYDECWTFLGYVHRSIWGIVMNDDPAANNHILHTLLMKGSYGLFGGSEFALRVPVLLSFAIYILIIHKLFQRRDDIWSFAVSMALIYQPYLLDYFVAARGYGISITATMAVVYYLSRYAENLQRKHAIIALFAAFLAAWANFTYLLILIATIGAVLWVAFNAGKWIKLIPTIIGSLFVTGAVFFVPIKRLIVAEELYYGGQTGFYQDTLQPIAARMLYQEGGNMGLGMFMGLILVALSAFMFRYLRTPNKDFAYWSAWLLIIAILGSILQHYLLGSPFLIDRTAIFIVPLFLVSLSVILERIRSSKLKDYAGILLLVFVVWNGYRAYNFDYLLDFKEHADTGKAMRWMAENRDRLPNGEFQIGKSVYMNATINYYRQRFDLQDLKHAGLEYCDDQAYPVYHLFEKDLACLSNRVGDTIAYYPISGTYLFLAR